MRWDSLTFDGKHGEWTWFVSHVRIEHVSSLIVREHVGKQLCVAAFDGGGRPQAHELVPDFRIPTSQSDEWYVFDDPLPPIERLERIERFVKYGGFNLADPRALAETFDKTWERDGLDWLYPLQEQFWRQLEDLRPISYIASGDRDVVVTRNESFANAVLDPMQFSQKTRRSR